MLRTAVFYGLIALLGWGSADFYAGKLSRKVGNLWTAFWITAFSLLLVIAYASTSHLQLGNISAGSYFYLGLAALFQTFGGFNFYEGLKNGKIGLVSVIASPWSIIVVSYSVLFLHEYTTALQLGAIATIIVGTMIASLSFDTNSKGKIKFSDPGIIYAFLALVNWGIGFIFLNQSIAEVGWLNSEVIFLVLSFVFIGFYIIAWKKAKVNFSIRDLSIWKFAFLAGLLSAIAYAGYSIGVGNYSKTLIAPIAAAYPVATIILSYTFNKEKLSRSQIFGVSLVILGAILISL